MSIFENLKTWVRHGKGSGRNRKRDVNYKKLQQPVSIREICFDYVTRGKSRSLALNEEALEQALWTWRTRCWL